MKKLAFALIITFLALQVKAQIDTSAAPSLVVENIVEQIMQSQDLEEADFDEIFDDLLYYYRHKINLNTATEEQLARLRFLSDAQIQAILDYRDSTGDFISIYELLLIPELSRQDIALLVPFVTVRKVEKTPPFRLKYVLRYGRHQIFLRDKFYVQDQKGYILPDTVETRYLGNKHKLYFRYKFYYRNYVLAGITAEKDAGEQFFRGAQRYGFDFYSAHLEVNKLHKHIDRIVVGDFQGKFGQGLVLWNGFAMGKSAYVLNVRRRPQGLRKYSSTDENRFFRGAGITAKFGEFYISTFASYKHIDGNVQQDTLDSELPVYVSSLLSTGYHRTPSEIAKRHTIAEAVAGADVTYKGKSWHLGMTAITYHWSVPFVRDSAIYRLNTVNSNYGLNAGFNWFYLSHKFSFFGEAATDLYGNPVLLTAFTLPMHYRLEAVVLYRYYSPGYFGYYSNAFSESTRPENEQGLYTGLRILPAKGWEVSLYFDRYSFPWMRYRLYEPRTWGNDLFMQVDYAPSRRLSMYWRLRYELKPQNLTADTLVMPLILPTQNAKIRYHVSYQLNNQVFLRTRLEWSFYQKDQPERGFMMYQDLKYRHPKLPLTVYWRFAIFDAPYNARIYAYENDVLYAFSVPAYFYQGFRTYILVKYQLTNKVTFWLRYAQTTYTDRDQISPGSLNEIDGNTKSEIKFQVRIKL